MHGRLGENTLSLALAPVNVTATAIHVHATEAPRKSWQRQPCARLTLVKTSVTARLHVRDGSVSPRTKRLAFQSIKALEPVPPSNGQDEPRLQRLIPSIVQLSTAGPWRRVRACEHVATA